MSSRWPQGSSESSARSPKWRGCSCSLTQSHYSRIASKLLKFRISPSPCANTTCGSTPKPLNLEANRLFWWVPLFLFCPCSDYKCGNKYLICRTCFRGSHQSISAISQWIVLSSSRLSATSSSAGIFWGTPNSGLGFYTAQSGSKVQRQQLRPKSASWLWKIRYSKTNLGGIR